VDTLNRLRYADLAAADRLAPSRRELTSAPFPSIWDAACRDIHDERFTPAPLLVDMAKSGKKFHPQ